MPLSGGPPDATGGAWRRRLGIRRVSCAEEICGLYPDIAFVEYAVNDPFPLITPPVMIRQAIEGFLRSVKERYPCCDIKLW